MEVKYPHVKVRLVGVDSNAFVVIGTCIKAARRAGLSNEQIEEFRKEASSGDYDKVLQTCIAYFNVS